jgi:hypothetical protein
LDEFARLICVYLTSGFHYSGVTKMTTRVREDRGKIIGSISRQRFVLRRAHIFSRLVKVSFDHSG